MTVSTSTVQCYTTHLTHHCNNECRNEPQFCFIPTFLGLFHLSEPAWSCRLSKGLVVYIHFTGFFCIYYWLGDELSTHVILTDLSIFGKVLNVYATAIEKRSIFCLIEHVVTEHNSIVSVCFTSSWIINPPQIKRFIWHIK